jgi:hypothetical protein
VAATILQITSVATLLGQNILNRWHFVNTAGLTDVSTVLPAFRTNVIVPLASDSSIDITYSELLYRIITDPLDPQRSYGVGFPVVGTQGNPAAPSFVAITAKWAPGTTVLLPPGTDGRRIRRGGKRIAGFPEIAFLQNTVTPANVSACAAVLDGYLGMSDGGFLPCIAGFPVQPPRGTDPDNPLLQIPNRYALIEGVTVRPLAGSQVSRKVGHGT